uniref:prephenate dehydratase domain-containing protein n=1 Tax=Sphingomonas sp. TaxID=28214 RepID=UPI00286B0C1E
MRIAYQGVPGAFSHEACLAFAPDCEALAEGTFADVVTAVLDGIVDRGILPMANSAGGDVPGNRELLDDPQLKIVKSQPLLVRMHLMALPGVAIEDIRTVVSHPMALKQCAAQIAALRVATEE